MKTEKPLKREAQQQLQALSESAAWQTFIARLEELHPVNKGLSATATQEQRAMYQIYVQAFQQILTVVKNIHGKPSIPWQESDYGIEETPQE